MIHHITAISLVHIPTASEHQHAAGGSLPIGTTLPLPIVERPKIHQSRCKLPNSCQMLRVYQGFKEVLSHGGC